MKVIEEIVADKAVLHLSGRLDSTTVADVEPLVLAAVGRQDTILDLAETAYVSSAGLRIFLKAAKTSKAAGHRLLLAGLSPSVAEVFEISGFTGLFSIHADIAAALIKF